MDENNFESIKNNENNFEKHKQTVLYGRCFLNSYIHNTSFKLVSDTGKGGGAKYKFRIFFTMKKGGE